MIKAVVMVVLLIVACAPREWCFEWFEEVYCAESWVLLARRGHPIRTVPGNWLVILQIPPDLVVIAPR
jgi:hypothetical protein